MTEEWLRLLCREWTRETLVTFLRTHNIVRVRRMYVAFHVPQHDSCLFTSSARLPLPRFSFHTIKAMHSHYYIAVRAYRLLSTPASRRL